MVPLTRTASRLRSPSRWAATRTRRPAIVQWLYPRSHQAQERARRPRQQFARSSAAPLKRLEDLVGRRTGGVLLRVAAATLRRIRGADDDHDGDRDSTITRRHD